MTGDAGKISAPETRRRLQAVELATRDADHPIAPKSVGKKIRLCFPDEVFLFAVIWRTWLNHEALAELIMAWAKVCALAVKINFVGHVIEGPDAMALSAI